MNETLLLVTFIIAVAFIFDFTNGFHDAANAIATSVATRALTTRQALTMAAVMNFAGVLAMTTLNATVAETIYNMVDFKGQAHESLLATFKGYAVALRDRAYLGFLAAGILMVKEAGGFAARAAGPIVCGGDDSERPVAVGHQRIRPRPGRPLLFREPRPVPARRTRP